MDYREIMDLILKYGADKQKLGLMICKTPFSAAEYQDLEDHKQIILNQICDVILKLTKEA
jgi:hypothetical protein